MMTIETMTKAAAIQRMVEVQERMEQIGGKHRSSRTEDVEFGHLADEFDQLQRHVENSDRRAAIAGAAGEGGGGLRIERGINPYQARSSETHSPQRDSAMRQLERSVKAGLPATGAETVERLLETGTDPERSWVSRWVCDTGSDAYRSAFAKLVMHGEQRAGLEFTTAERDAFDRVTALKGEQRAMSLTDSAGGYLVPFELDPTVILTSSGSTNPLLEIGRVVNAVSDVWNGVSSAGVTAEWLAEASEAADGSPSMAEPSIPNYKGSVFVPFSVELQGDAIGLMGELGRLLHDGFTQLLNTALTTGSGTGQPTGIVTALAGGSSQVNTATNDTLVSADVYSLQNALPPRFQPNAKWCGSLAILNLLRQMETTNGALKFPSLQNDPPTLLGRDVRELSNMTGVITGSQNNELLVYGDFTNYVITQRVGSSIELIPHLFGANRRPTGQRGVWLWARYGADSVNDNAFRLLTA